MPKPTKKATNKSNEQVQQKLFADTNVTMKSGHLTKNAVMVSNDKFAKLRIASNKQYLDSTGKIASITNYFNILISQKLEDTYKLAKTLKKGGWIYVKGEDSTQSFDTPEGYRQIASTIFANKLILKQTSAGNREDVGSTAAKLEASKG